MAAEFHDPFFGPSERVAPVAVPGAPVEPVEITHRRDHKFVTREERGCAQCGKGKTNMAHVGAPPSLNVFGSGANRFVYQGQKKAWSDRITELLIAAELPRPLGGVLAEGMVCFPDRTRRDQGNYRFLLEKALGDTLTAGGWLADDDWAHYEFGGLGATYVKGESWTRLRIIARPVELDAQPTLL